MNLIFFRGFRKIKKQSQIFTIVFSRISAHNMVKNLEKGATHMHETRTIDFQDKLIRKITCLVAVFL